MLFDTNAARIQNTVKRWKSRSCSWPQHLLLTARLPQPQLTTLLLYNCLQTSKTCLLPRISFSSLCGLGNRVTNSVDLMELGGSIYSRYHKMAPQKITTNHKCLWLQIDDDSFQKKTMGLCQGLCLSNFQLLLWQQPPCRLMLGPPYPEIWTKVKISRLLGAPIKKIKTKGSAFKF